MNIKKYLFFLIFLTKILYSNVKTEASSFIISVMSNIVAKELTKKNANDNLTFGTEAELKNFY